MKTRVRWKKAEVWLFGAPLLVLAAALVIIYVRNSSPQAPMLLSQSDKGGHLQTFVQASAFSQDVKQVAGAKSAGPVQVWDVESGVLKHTLYGHHDGHHCDIKSVAFSPDGKALAGGGYSYLKTIGGEVRLWDAQTGAVIWSHCWPKYKRAVNRLAFAPNGKWIALGMNLGDIVILNAADGTLWQTLPGQSSIFCLAFSPDNKMLASSEKLWDLTTGHPVRSIGYADELVTFAPNNRTIAVSKRGGLVEVQDIMTSTVQCVITTGRSGSVVPVRYVPDGTLIGNDSETRSNFVVIWSSTTGEILRRIEMPKPDLVVSLGVFAPDGKMLVALGSQGVYVWRFRR